MKWQAKLQQAEASVDRLSVRERLMLFACAIVITWGFWEALLAAPLDARSNRLTTEIAARQARIAQLDESMNLTADGLGGDMQQRIERLRSLERQYGSNEDRLEALTRKLIDPEQMRFVLEGLLDRQQGLRLVRAANLEVQPLIRRADEQAMNSAPNLYRHGLLLELEGSYLDLLAYLEAAEQLP